jgi:hypothetical protein
MHKPLFLATVGSVAAVGGLLIASALPAGAATSVQAETTAFTTCTAGSITCGDTTTTFTITSTGTLSITVPLTASLGSGVIGQAGAVGTTDDFGAVTVTDNRAISPADWTATVSSTDFTNGNGVSADTIPASDATYTAGTVTDINNLAAATSAFAAGTTLANSTQDVVVETGADGVNSSTWTPTITVALPPNTVVGTYTGTVEHSVT